MGNRCSIQQSEEINCCLSKALKIDCIDRSVISGPPCIDYLIGLETRSLPVVTRVSAGCGDVSAMSPGD